MVLSLWLAASPHVGGLLAFLAALTAGAALAIAAAPGDGAGAGGEGGDPAEGDGGDPGADPAEAAGDDPDAGDGRGTAARAEGDDPDGGDEDDIDSLPEKNVRTRLRRLERTYRGKHAPILSLFTDPETGQLLDQRTVTQMITRARDMEEMEGLLEGNPDLLQTILDVRAGKKGRTDGRRAQEALEDAFDEAGVPFETDSESGKYLLNLAKTVHELQSDNKRLRSELGQVNQRDGARTLQSVENSWRARTLAAVAELPDEIKALAVPAVQARFAALRAQNQLHRTDPRKVIEAVVGPYRTLVKGRGRAAAADQARRATNNQNRPGNAVTRGTAPARSGDTNTQRKETIRDAKQSFFARVGGSATPGGRR